MKKPSILIPSERIGDIEYHLINDEETLFAARRFHHDAYLNAPRIPISEPQPGGVIDDDYVDQSDYFVAIKPIKDSAYPTPLEILAVMRVILYTDEYSLPALKNYELYSNFKKELSLIDLNRSVELSAFASVGPEAAKGLFRFIWKYSSVREDTHWFVSLHERTYDFFYRFFKFQFRNIGETGNYLGKTAPYVMVLSEQERYFIENYPNLHKYYTGPTPEFT